MMSSQQYFAAQRAQSPGPGRPASCRPARRVDRNPPQTQGSVPRRTRGAAPAILESGLCTISRNPVAGPGRPRGGPRWVCVLFPLRPVHSRDTARRRGPALDVSRRAGRKKRLAMAIDPTQARRPLLSVMIILAAAGGGRGPGKNRQHAVLQDSPPFPARRFSQDRVHDVQANGTHSSEAGRSATKQRRCRCQAHVASSTARLLVASKPVFAEFFCCVFDPNLSCLYVELFSFMLKHSFVSKRPWEGCQLRAGARGIGIWILSGEGRRSARQGVRRPHGKQKTQLP